MKKQKIYEADDQMVALIKDDYSILQSLGRFGINLGFGDKTVQEVCEEQSVDTYTFLAIVNFYINGTTDMTDMHRISMPTVLHYLKSSHDYFIDFQLPDIRKRLEVSLDENDNLARLIVKLYDEFAHQITQHMHYEEKTVFPYVDALSNGDLSKKYDIQTFSRHHGQVTQTLRELKNIIIKYLPSNPLKNNQLTETLYKLYNMEDWLMMHSEVEDKIFVPAIKNLENKLRQTDVSQKISEMISQNPNNDEALSDREKEVIVSLVQGMTNKEIAEHLYISVNTVITHRRNIAKKLQIHSPAGLTIYAIVNNLIDISSVKL